MKYSENHTAFRLCVGLEAACIAAAASVYAIRHFPVAKGVLVLIQAASLTALAIAEKPLPAWCVCMMLTAFLLFLAEFAAKGRTEVPGLLPLFAVALLLLCQLPRPKEPFDWSFVKDAYTDVQEKVQTLALDISYLLEGEDRFSFTFEGYGNSGGLGGSVLNGAQAQLHISGSDTKNPLYLTGAVYDTYTGSGWQSTPNLPGGNALWSQSDNNLQSPSKQGERTPQSQVNGNASQPQSDAMLYALSQSIYAEDAEALTSSALLSIEYRFIKTADFFHELHTTDLYFYGDTPQFEPDAPWTMQKARGKDFTYQLRFLEFNENSDEIKALLRGQAWLEDAAWNTASDSQQADTEADIKADMKVDTEVDTEADIREVYTKLPDTIPTRVYELADTIAADADNDYDRMTAFAEYLKDYEYTKTPAACPDDREFTDYFLFDSKAGYCTYFATAMAVLGRCEGIPTRYVQGFMTTDTCQNASSDVTITGKQAHAWTEVYIEHVGWVRFDATPGYGETETDKWALSEVPLAAPTGSPYPYETLPEESLSEDTSDNKKEAPYDALAVLKMMVTLLMCTALAVVLMVWLKNMLRRQNYARMDIQGKVRIQMKRILRLGKLQGAALSEGETLQAYAARTHGILDTEEYPFATACALYESIRFASETASLTELTQLEAYVTSAERTYLTRCGLLRKLLYRIM